MSLEWDELPADALPPGWSLGRLTPDRLVYRCDDLGISLEGIRVDANDTHPVLGLTRCWELRLRYSIGEADVDDRLVRVSTRHELQKELRSYLQFVGRHLSDVADLAAALRAFRARRSR